MKTPLAPVPEANFLASSVKNLTPNEISVKSASFRPVLTEMRVSDTTNFSDCARRLSHETLRQEWFHQRDHGEDEGNRDIRVKSRIPDCQRGSRFTQTQQILCLRNDRIRGATGQPLS